MQRSCRDQRCGRRAPGCGRDAGGEAQPRAACPGCLHGHGWQPPRPRGRELPLPQAGPSPCVRSPSSTSENGVVTVLASGRRDRPEISGGSAFHPGQRAALGPACTSPRGLSRGSCSLLRHAEPRGPHGRGSAHPASQRPHGLGPDSRAGVLRTESLREASPAGRPGRAGAEVHAAGRGCRTPRSCVEGAEPGQFVWICLTCSQEGRGFPQVVPLGRTWLQKGSGFSRPSRAPACWTPPRRARGRFQGLAERSPAARRVRRGSPRHLGRLT